jgi:transposase
MHRIQEELKKHAHQNTRAHCLYGYFNLGQTKSDLAKQFHKDKKTVGNWIKKYEETGELQKSSRSSYFVKVNQEQREWIVNLFKNKPVLFQKEAVRLYFNEYKELISPRTISRILKEYDTSNVRTTCISSLFT